MKETELLQLEFEKNLTEEFEGDDDYYYNLDIVNGLSFITNCKSEIKDDEWMVEVFDTYPSIIFTDFVELKMLIDILKSKIVNK